LKAKGGRGINEEVTKGATKFRVINTGNRAPHSRGSFTVMIETEGTYRDSLKKRKTDG